MRQNQFRRLKRETKSNDIGIYAYSISEMFEQFMLIKKGEGLAKRTIKEYYNNFQYFMIGMARIARILFENGKIDSITLEKLLEIIKYRNLVVHGHISMVEKEMFEKLQELNTIIETKLQGI